MHSHTIATTWFTGYKHQWGKHYPVDSYKHVKMWYESVNRAKVNAIIFHDSFTDEFVDRYTSDYVTFVKDDGLLASEMCTIDYRWTLFHSYFSKTSHEVLFFTDCRDVVVGNGDFVSQVEKGKIYIGDEPIIAGKSKWAKRYIDLLYPEYAHWDELLLNPGLLGGHRDTILPFLRYFMDEIDSGLSNPLHKHCYVDMQAVNGCIRDYFPEDRIIHGEPVNSLYRKKQYGRRDVWFIHK